MIKVPLQDNKNRICPLSWLLEQNKNMHVMQNVNCWPFIQGLSDKSFRYMLHVEFARHVKVR